MKRTTGCVVCRVEALEAQVKRLGAACFILLGLIAIDSIIDLIIVATS